MRDLNYFAQFVLCSRCEKPFTVVSPDRIKCPYCGEAGSNSFGPLFSNSCKNLMELLEHVYAQRESWKNHGVFLIGLAVFDTLLSEVFQSFMDSKKLPWIFERPIIRHVPWQEKFDFLIEGAHLEDHAEKLKSKLKEMYDLRVHFLHGKAQSLHPNIYQEMYDLVGEMLQLFAEIYFQLDLKPYFYQQVKEESRPLRRGSESHISVMPR